MSCDLVTMADDDVPSELSLLTTKWKPGKARSVLDLYVDEDKGRNEVVALEGGMRRALENYQVCWKLNVRGFDADRSVCSLKDL
jgi:hypothetical protein